MRKASAWVAALVLAVAPACGGSDRSPGYVAYEAYRQTASQEIPGTWGTHLDPLPDDYDPKLTPSQVLDRFARNTPRGAIILDLADVRQSVVYVVGGTPQPALGGPAWVFLTRGVCFNSEKGALVASSRRPDNYPVQRCSLANISVLAVNADTGKLILTARGYDDTLEWSPARAGNPMNPGTSPSEPAISQTPSVPAAPSS